MELICNAFAEHSASSMQITFKRKKRGREGERKKEREKGGKERRKHEGMCFNGVGEIQFIIGM